MYRSQLGSARCSASIGLSNWPALQCGVQLLTDTATHAVMASDRQSKEHDGGPLPRFQLPLYPKSVQGCRNVLL